MQKLYEENPAMFRNHPFQFILYMLLVIGSIALPIVLVPPLEPQTAVLVGFASFVAGVLILLVWYVQTKASKLSITESNVLYEKGILSKVRYEMDIDQIRTVVVRQSFVNRILGVGEVTIFTTGDTPEVVVPGLPNPNKVRELIKTNRDD